MTSRSCGCGVSHIEWQKIMVKSCCAVGCTNRVSKGSGFHFHRFPSEPERRSKDYVPSIFDHIGSLHQAAAD